MSSATIPFEASLPCLTAAVPAVHAAVKRRYEDFRVEEIPAYPPCGEGAHCFFTIEKRGIATQRAVGDIAHTLGIPSKNIGLAGLKDARAVAVQTLSIEHVDPEQIKRLDIPRIRVLSVSRHKNKLKIGHLRGNRFHIKLREVEAGRLDDLRSVCDVLVRRGVPNFFGRQRFGVRGDTWELGKGVLNNDARTVVDLMLGRPGPFDSGDVLEARRRYEAGRFSDAARAWPHLFRDNARVCRVMDRSNGNHRRAYHAIDARMMKFFVNAYQSRLFNHVLAQRVHQLDRVQVGDLAYKHDHGGVFRVVDAPSENNRADAFEISPTGPIFGRKMTRATGVTGELEQAVLDGEGVTLEAFGAVKRMKLHGSRRPLRFRPEGLDIESGSDEHGPFVALRLALPPGCYATMILREICKDRLEEGLEGSA